MRLFTVPIRNTFHLVFQLAGIALLAFVLPLASCGGGGKGGSPGVGPSQQQGNDAVFGIASPAAVRDASGVGFSEEFKRGSQIITGEGILNNNASSVDGLGVFTPNWTSPESGTENLAYAVYCLDAHSAVHTKSAKLSVQLETAGAGPNAWIGLPDLERNTWKWFELPADGLLTEDIADYIDREDYDLYVVTLFTGTDTWKVDYLSCATSLATMHGSIDTGTGAPDGFGVQFTVEGEFTEREEPFSQGTYWSIKVPYWLGEYTITPHFIGWEFDPPSRTVELGYDDSPTMVFTLVRPETHTVSGKLNNTDPAGGAFYAQAVITRQDGKGGEFRFDTLFDGSWSCELPDGEYYLGFETPPEWDLNGGRMKFNPVRRAFSVSGGNASVNDVEMVFEELHKLDGYVFQPDGVTPATGVVVNIRDISGDCFTYHYPQAVVDDTGYWSMEIRPSRYELFASQMIIAAPNSSFSPAKQVVKVINEDIRLDPFVAESYVRNQCKLYGYVYEIDGITPIEQARIEFGIQGEKVYTDSKGYYEYQAINGYTYQLKAVDPRFSFLPQTMHVVVNNDTQALDFRGTPGTTYTISGHVLENDGITPIADRPISIRNASWNHEVFSRVSDASGYWEVEGIGPGDYFIGIASSPVDSYAFDQTYVTIQVVDADLIVPDFTGTPIPTYDVEGWVYEDDGVTPIEDALVNLDILETYTGADGHYIFEDIPVGPRGVIVNRAPYVFGSYGQQTFELEDGNIVLPPFTGTRLPSQTVDGYIRIAGSEDPAANLEINFDSQTTGQPPYTMYTDGSGYFSIDLPRDRVWVMWNLMFHRQFLVYNEDITLDTIYTNVY